MDSKKKKVGFSFLLEGKNDLKFLKSEENELNVETDSSDFVNAA